MKLSTCTVALCFSMVSAQRRSQGIANIGNIEIDGSPGYSYDEDGQIIASLIEEAVVAEAGMKMPEEGTIINDAEFPFLVQVSPSVTQVFFQYDNPQGVTSDWMKGEHENNSIIFSLSMSSYLGPGDYIWRFKTVDSSREELLSADTTFSVDPESTIFGTLRSMIGRKIENDQDLAEHYKTLVVQDCAYNCDGCVDLVHEDPYGLSSVIDTLEDVWMESEIHGISRADIFTLAGLVGAEMSTANSGSRNPEEFPMQWTGRINCEHTVPYCVALDGGQIMCGPKAAPVNVESNGMGAMAAGVLNIETLDESTLLDVIETGDSTLNLVPCSDPGPCYV